MRRSPPPHLLLALSLTLTSVPTPSTSAPPPSTWDRITIPGLRGACSAFDPVRHQMIVMGGNDGRAPNPSVWSLSSDDRWTRMRDNFPETQEASAIYDPLRDRVVVFGGEPCFQVSGAWILTLGPNPIYLPLATQGQPPRGRGGHLAGYDATADRMIVFGGRKDTLVCQIEHCGCQALVRFNDVWQLTLSTPPTWSEIQPINAGPPTGSDAGFFDQRTRRFYVLRGATLWFLELAGTPTWQSVSTSGTPPTDPGKAVLDSTADRALFYDGTDTWTLSLGATPNWVKLPRATTGSFQDRGFVLELDELHNRLISFGGSVSSGCPYPDDVWELPLTGGGDWNKRPPASGPGPISFGKAVIDSRRHEALLFDSQGGNRLFALKLLNGGQWTPVVTPPLAAPLNWCAAIYDPLGDRLILVLDETGATWALNREGPPVWTLLLAQGPLLRFHSSAYDSRRNRVLVFGGSDTDSSTWSLSLDDPVQWNQVKVEGAGAGRRFLAQAAYDYDQDRMVVFGGFLFDQQGGDVWALSGFDTGPTWSRLRSSAPPGAAGIFTSGMFDPHRNRVVIASAHDPFLHRFLWSTDLDVAEPFAPWELDGPSCDREYGLCPLPRTQTHSLYDSSYDRMLLFGGRFVDSYGSCGMVDDTWALSWAYMVSVASLAQADATSDRARIVWSVGELASATVYRADAPDAWTLRGVRAQDGAGQITFEDRDVEPGHRYGYRLGIAGPEGESFHGEVWVDIPLAARLAITAIHPNPGRGPFRVSFSLANAEPAVLEVHDVAGRRVVSRRLAGLTQGGHVIDLDESARLEAGLYFVRLRQGGSIASVKAALVR